MKIIKVKAVLLEEMLGASSSNPDIHKEFIASKSADAEKMEEELKSLHTEELVEKVQTIFPKTEDGKPFIWDYQIRGHFKEACSMLRRVKTTKKQKGSLSSDLTAFKKVIDGLVFVEPRKILVNIPKGKKMGNCQRPLRGQTAQGERITLANSETIPEGSTFEFKIVLLDETLEKLVIEWLDYGKYNGLLQWRNSGKGKFDYKITK